ncbi:hypothetical protein RclHR1_11790004 [Rhizophagus clarus]|uniref:Uncharacterized protein n=1 Tax=Rhizophagus clarus TaxID=94130 RepID=A0A2Z6Q5C8_9GLOM|nr:hypothetical protein RclHR1_11790004 [Rhizophagus clarus]
MDSGPVENPENFKKYTTKKNEDYVWFLIVDDTMLHLIVFSRKELNYATPGFLFVGNKRTEIPPRLVVHTTRTKYISRIGVSDCSSEAIIYNIIRFQVAWVLPCLNQIRVIFVGKNYYAKEKK